MTTLINQVIEQLKAMDDSSLIAIYNDYASNNSYETIFDNDDDNINTMLDNPYDAIKSAFYGDYNPSHYYFIFNGYGNLASFNYVTDDNSPIDNEELAEWLISEDKLSGYDIEVITADDMLASIEDNITDDEDMLHRLSDYLNIDLNDKDKDNFSSFDHFILDSCLNVISDYDLEQLNSIITLLGINYE